MDILVGFAPWILFWVLSSNDTFRIAIFASLICAVAFNIPRFLKHNSKILEIGSLIFFAIMAIGSLLVEVHWLERWINVLGNAALTLIALVSLLIGNPFTLQKAHVLFLAVIENGGWKMHARTKKQPGWLRRIAPGLLFGTLFSLFGWAFLVFSADTHLTCDRLDNETVVCRMTRSVFSKITVWRTTYQPVYGARLGEVTRTRTPRSSYQYSQIFLRTDKGEVQVWRVTRPARQREVDALNAFISNTEQKAFRPERVRDGNKTFMIVGTVFLGLGFLILINTPIALFFPPSTEADTGRGSG